MSAVASNHRARKRQVWRSVFPEVSQPTPQATPLARFPDKGQPFGGPPSFHAPGGSAASASGGGGGGGGAGGQLRPRVHAQGGATPSAGGNGSFSSSSHNITGRDVPETTDRRSNPPPPSGMGLGLGLSGMALPRSGGVGVASSSSSPPDDQTTYDRAWHVVTSRVVLPSTVSAEDSFGTLAPESQLLAHSASHSHAPDAAAEAEFQTALRLVLDAKTALPRALHTEDILTWHTQQVRQHFTQHVIPMLSACADGPVLMAVPAAREDANAARAGQWVVDRHMAALVSSIRTLEAAFRLYEYGLSLILRGLGRGPPRPHHVSEPAAIDVEMEDAASVVDAVARRFRQDVRALVGNSAPPELMVSARVVLVSLVSRTLGIPESNDGDCTGDGRPVSLARSGPGRPAPRPPLRPAPPDDDNMQSVAARQRLHDLVGSLADVGLAGERFQILFAEVMDRAMSEFIHGAFADAWMPHDAGANLKHPDRNPRTPGPSGRRPSRRSAAGPPTTQSSCIATLDLWIEDHFARLALEVLRLVDLDHPEPAAKPGVSLAEVKKWKEIGLGRLAALRISELFDIVLHWPRSKSGIDDLRASVTTPQRRLQLTDAFSTALQTRLLHSSRSTLEILQVYIAMIRTFHALDQSKVLLSRVVPSLQLYLCQREDAIRRVVTGLLGNPGGETGHEKSFATPTAPSSTKTSKSAKTAASAPRAAVGKDASLLSRRPRKGAADSLVELAELLNDPSQQRRQANLEDDDLDWADMDWVPDPVDAGANYKRPRSEDVIGTLISALGSEDVFIKEFQSIIAERLLSQHARFEQEIRVLLLLKKRFGDGALQNCDVMVRDIRDSTRLDATIRKAQFVARRRGRPDPEEEGVKYRARILSRLFWPSMPRESFLLPKPVAHKQAQYEKGYEQLKSSRRLTWLDHLGQATVELELRDRELSIQCRTFEAAVIYAFQPEPDEDEEDADAGEGGGQPPEIQRSLEELQGMLQMDEDLVLQALEFWIAKRVLRRVGADSYVVNETLSSADHAPAGRAELPTDGLSREGDTAGAASSPTKTAGTGGASGGSSGEKARAQQQRAVYGNFIVGMLTNSAGSMPLGQIAMMMKMMIAEGFHWSNEELQEFLAEKVAAGELEVVAGGKYRLVKK